MLFVRPEYRGRGCGRKLVEWAVARQEADSVDVNEQNPQAMGFYLRMGFAVAGRSETDDVGRPFPILHLRLGSSRNPMCPGCSSHATRA